MYSQYRGVSWNKKNNAWQARIRHGGEVLSLGYFDCDERAAQAFDMVALRIHGDFARTNFPAVKYDRSVVQNKSLEEVLSMARAMSRKRRKTTDREKEKEQEREALRACKGTLEENPSEETPNVDEKQNSPEDAGGGGEQIRKQIGEQLGVLVHAAERAAEEAAEVTRLREEVKNLKQHQITLMRALQDYQIKCNLYSKELEILRHQNEHYGYKNEMLIDANKTTSNNHVQSKLDRRDIDVSVQRPGLTPLLQSITSRQT